MAALPALAAAVLAGCSGHHAAPQARKTARPPAGNETIQPPPATYMSCAAADLTGRLGVIRRGTGRYARNVILTNNSGRPCTLAGGPSEITGVRRNGRRVRLVTGATPGVSVDYGLVGPANLRPGQSAQVVIHIPSWRGSCERYALSPVANARRWPLPLLSPLLSTSIRRAGPVSLLAAHDASAPGTFPPRSWSVCAAPSPPLGLTATAPIRRRGGVKGRFACTLTRHVDLCSLPCGQIGP